MSLCFYDHGGMFFFSSPLRAHLTVMFYFTLQIPTKVIVKKVLHPCKDFVTFFLPTCSCMFGLPVAAFHLICKQFTYKWKCDLMWHRLRILMVPDRPAWNFWRDASTHLRHLVVTSGVKGWIKLHTIKIWL